MPTKKVRIISAVMTGGLVFTGAAVAVTTSHASAHPALAAKVATSTPINLDNCPVLEVGYRGGCASQLQTELNVDNGTTMPVDGFFGPETKKAVITFQNNHHIVPADGIVGPQTKAVLDNPGSSPVAAPISAASGSSDTANPVSPNPSPASTVNGNVPDSRTPSIAGEIIAMYWHGLNRNPDPTGFNQYILFANQNCRWGVLSASFQILNSAEAHNVWQNNPQTLAGMLFAALLNRPPDPSGLQTYTAAITQRGLPWATASMMASPEYSARLADICHVQGETATMYTWQQAKTFRDTLLKLAANEGAFCFGKKAFDKVLDLQSNEDEEPTVDNPIGEILTVAYSITNQIVADFHLDGTCGAMKAYLMAALKVFETYRGGGGDNPVFVQYSVGKASFWTHQQPFTVRIGPNPTSWTGYSGKSW